MNLYKNVERNKDGHAEDLLVNNEIAICQYFMDTEKVNKLHFVRDKIEFSLDNETHEKIKEVVSKILIRYRGFISSPASAKYHGNYEDDDCKQGCQTGSKGKPVDPEFFREKPDQGIIRIKKPGISGKKQMMKSLKKGIEACQNADPDHCDQKQCKRASPGQAFQKSG